MLSRPPASLASSIRRVAAASRFGALARISLIALLGDHRGQPVAAEQHHVAGADRVGPGVDLDLGLRAERARDDRALRMLGRLLLGQLPLPDELVDERVVLGQARQLAVAEQIRAAVADVGDRHLGVIEVRGREGRPHPLATVLGARAIVDPVVGLPDAIGESLLRACRSRAAPARRSRSRSARRPRRPARHPSRRRRRTPARARRRCPRCPGAGVRCRSCRWSRRLGASSLHVRELGIADPDPVPGVQRLRAVRAALR